MRKTTNLGVMFTLLPLMITVESLNKPKKFISLSQSVQLKTNVRFYSNLSHLQYYRNNYKVESKGIGGSLFVRDV